MKKLIFITIILLLLPSIYSKEGRMPLLAVKQVDSEYEGSTAELLLELEEGTGRVFVDTFPLSKLDTQISMRFAKEIACDFLDMDCNNLDFIYTIRAESPIIGGPSAGAAATVLTVSLLSDTKIKEGITLTGTINSGGLIGPVGGLKEKIEAGANSGLITILIPEGEIREINESNISIDMIEYGNQLNVTTIEVSDLNSALEYFTGILFKSFDEEIKISHTYKETMQGLANKLCNRTMELRNMITSDDLDNETLNTYNIAMNLSRRAEDALAKQQIYTTASYCFGANIRLSQVFLEMKNFSDRKYEGLLEELKSEILEFEESIDKKEIKTITDLESYMIVKERIIEALEYANLTENISYAYSYAYANERLRSAHSWAEFFKNKGKVLELNNESLKASCSQRIAEAEERLQYASIYFPIGLRSAREELNRAYDDFREKKYALSLFKASKAKAEANIVLNTLGIEENFVPKLIENKLNAAARAILKSEKKNIFPILGYSYYEYAQNLKETDKYSALLYAEYALELSNLDIYFKEKNNIVSVDIDMTKISFLSIGIILGILIGILIKNKPKRRKKKSKKKKSSQKSH